MDKYFFEKIGVLFIGIALAVSGCGYTTQSLLPSNFKTIYVDNFKNNIKVTAEQDNTRMYRGYRPGMENELTTQVINKYLRDGNLKIASEKNADLALRGELMDFQREPLRYDYTNNTVLEYRIKLIVNIELTDLKAGKLVWKEDGFAGETTYSTNSLSESAAITNAITDLSRRIVERTIEAW